MPANLSGPTLIVILFIVLLLFGAPKLPALARSLGQSMKILKKEVSSDEKQKDEAVVEEAAQPVQASTPAVVPSTEPSVEEQLQAAKREAEEARAEAEALKKQVGENAQNN